MTYDYFNPPKGVYAPEKLTLAEVAERASFMAGGQGRYELGEGGRRPSAAMPWTIGDKWPVACDCSGFSAWATGHDRRQFAHGDKLAAKDGELWFDTRTIVKDARRATGNLVYKVVPRTMAVVPGMLLVYSPDDVGLPYGHVGIITAVKDGFVRGSTKVGKEWWRFLEVTDCSTGRGATAIRTRKDARLWSAENRGGYIVRNIHNAT